MNFDEIIEKTALNLLSFQKDDGRFEGELSANTFPTCTYALAQMAMGRSVDNDMINWFIENQNNEGYWGLDASGVSENESTLFAKLVLKEIQKVENRGDVEAALAKSPDLPLNLWIIKIMYARCGHISWNELIAPVFLRAAMRIGEWIMPLLPKSLLSRFKPPMNYAPPTRLFYSAAFQELFIAEKHTLVPLLLTIEAHTTKRAEVIKALADWLIEHRCTDGSWFRVGLISIISLLALIDARNSGYKHPELDSVISISDEWMQKLRTHDGGCREAINLNVWDTALSVISLDFVDSGKYKTYMRRAAEWFVKNQNKDGGFCFSDLPDGSLLSDADDTALATLAMFKGDIGKEHNAIRRSLKWLKAHQSEDGGWGTYIPGSGDVSCVSITSHVIDLCLAMDELPKEMGKAIEWLKNSISDSGYWGDLWLARNTYGTALAIAALIKSGQYICPEIGRGVKWLEQVQNSDGGWGEDMMGNRIASTVEQTAWSTYALLLHNKNSPSAKRGLEYLISKQTPDGSWPSSCVGIYWEIIGGYTDPIYSPVFALMALKQATIL